MGNVFGSLASGHYTQIGMPHQLDPSRLSLTIIMDVHQGYWQHKDAKRQLRRALRPPDDDKAKNDKSGLYPLPTSIMFSADPGWEVPPDLGIGPCAYFDIANDRTLDAGALHDLQQQLALGGREALLYDLLQFDVNAPGARNPRCPWDDFSSPDPFLSWWGACLKRKAQLSGSEVWLPKIPVTELLNAFVASTGACAETRRAVETRFGISMRALKPAIHVQRFTLPTEKIAAGNRQPAKKQMRCYVFPPLSECISAFLSEHVIG